MTSNDEICKDRRRSIMSHPSFAKYLVAEPLSSEQVMIEGDLGAVTRRRFSGIPSKPYTSSIDEEDKGRVNQDFTDLSVLGKNIVNVGLQPLGARINRKPILVFWETTKACPLSCMHCRATALKAPQPGELSTDQGFELIRQVAQFGSPSPILVLTGGDVLMRSDLEELVSYAGSLDVRVALAPAVSDDLDAARMSALFNIGVRSVSLSLDGIGSTHDRVRGIEGHYQSTLDAISMLSRIGYRVQINTTVMSGNVYDLPAIAELLLRYDVKIWEVFFLIQTGRGIGLLELEPDENEDVARFLYQVTGYGISVRTVEAPFYRRVVLNLREGEENSAGLYPPGVMYRILKTELNHRLGLPTVRHASTVAATRDGKGIIFIAHNGDVYPSGFLPLSLGNIRSSGLEDIYQSHPLLKAIRSSSFNGRCGSCLYSDICGGSRSRAYSYFNDPLASDPGCVFVGA